MSEAININNDWKYQLTEEEVAEIEKAHAAYAKNNKIKVKYEEEIVYEKYNIIHRKPTTEIKDKKGIENWYNDLENKLESYKNDVKEIKLKRILYVEGTYEQKEIFNFEIDKNDERKNENEKDLTNTVNDGESLNSGENQVTPEEIENSTILINDLDTNNSLTAVKLQADCENATVCASITINESEKDMKELAEGMQLAMENSKGKELLDAFEKAGFKVDYETNNITANEKKIADALMVVRDFKKKNFSKVKVSKKATTKYLENEETVKEKLTSQINEINNIIEKDGNFKNRNRIRELRNEKGKYEIKNKIKHQKNSNKDNTDHSAKSFQEVKKSMNNSAKLSGEKNIPKDDTR